MPQVAPGLALERFRLLLQLSQQPVLFLVGDQKATGVLAQA